jgi:hypothetical protein
MFNYLNVFFGSVIIPTDLNAQGFSKLDALGNFYFAPLHGLLEAVGKKIHAYNIFFRCEIDSSKTDCTEVEMPLKTTAERTIFVCSKILYCIYWYKSLVVRVSDDKIKNPLSEEIKTKIKTVCDRLDKNLIFKITSVFITIFIVISWTIQGIICKVATLVFSSSVRKRYKIALHHLLIKKIIEKKAELQPIFSLVVPITSEPQGEGRVQSLAERVMKKIITQPNYRNLEIDNNVITHFIYPFFTIQELYEHRLVNKSYYNRTIDNQELSKTHCSFYGLSLQTQTSNSLLNIFYSVHQFRRDLNQPGMMSIFGIGKYIHIPTCSLNDPIGDYIRSIRELITNNAFAGSAAITRLVLPVLRTDSDKLGHISELFKELVLVKYTLYIPKENDLSEQDKIEHNHLLLACEKGASQIDIIDFMTEEYGGSGHSIFKNRRNQAIISPFGDSVKELLNNKPVGVIANRVVEHGDTPYYYIYRSTKPNYRQLIPDQNLYADIPIKLGHISKEEICKSFVKREHAGDVGDVGLHFPTHYALKDDEI